MTNHPLQRGKEGTNKAETDASMGKKKDVSVDSSAEKEQGASANTSAGQEDASIATPTTTTDSAPTGKITTTNSAADKANVSPEAAQESPKLKAKPVVSSPLGGPSDGGSKSSQAAELDPLVSARLNTALQRAEVMALNCIASCILAL